MTNDRTRSIYLAPWRLDIVARTGVTSPLSDAAMARTAAGALAAAKAPTPASITIVLTDDTELAELNRAHMGHEGPTDVLSFPMLPPGAFGRGVKTKARVLPTVTRRTHLGDIAISVERAAEQAEQGRGGQTGDVRWSVGDELRLLVTHGVLHLCGWDHAEPDEEVEMRAMERQLLG